MTGKTAISWTEKTWNPIVGCTIVSPGCTNCYAMKWAGRRLDGNPKSPHYAGTTQASKAGPVWTGKVALAPDHILTAPLRWRKPATIFVNSMSDLFHESVTDEQIDRVFAVMALTPQHTYQILTKRADRMMAYMNSSGRSAQIARAVLDIMIGGLIPKNYLRDETYDNVWPVCSDGPEDVSEVWLRSWPLPNVWLGVSVEDQARAAERIPHLLETPAAIRFISAEPLLGLIDLTSIDIDGYATADALKPNSWREVWESDWSPEATGVSFEEAKEAYIDEGGIWPPTDGRPHGLDWVICGGESGPGARPMHPDWARSLRDQCDAAGVPFFFKQWGEWVSVSEVEGKGDHFTFSDGVTLRRVGKSAAGDLLDGIQHHNWPRVAP